MNCKTCQYPLWNIAQRQCPECGSAFKPSDFEFAPDNVKYLCPYCNQQYFGTTPEGHLDPRSFACVTCHRTIDMDEMLLVPREGVPERLTQADQLPWTDPTLSWTTRFVRTMGWSLTSPTKLGRRVQSEGTFRAAFYYSLVVSGATIAVGLLPIVLLMFVMVFIAVGAGGGSGGGGGGGGVRMGAGAGMMLGMLLPFLIGIPIYVLLRVAVLSVLWHGILRISGSTAGGFSRTAQCVCYSSSTDILHAIPCLGAYASVPSFIWSTIIGTRMLRESQQVSTTRALFATLTPLILVLTLAAALVSSLILSMNRAIQRGATTTTIATTGPTGSSSVTITSPTGPLTSITEVSAERVRIALQQYAAPGKVPPAHGLELMADGSLSASGFMVSQFRASGTEQAVMGLPLVAYDTLAAGEIRDRVRKWIASQPAPLLAHRVGDVIFTYHGLTNIPDESLKFDPTNPPSAIWLAVVEERAWSPESAPIAYHAILPSGVVRIGAQNFTQALSEQNAFRQAQGLGRLPDPSSITADTPALASPATPPGGL